MGKVKVLGGSFPKQSCSYNSGQINLWDGKGANWGFKTQSVAETFETIEEVTEANKVKFGSAAGWGTVGALLAGPLGFAAGAILGGRGKQVTFVARLKDGRQFVGQTESKTYAKMLADILTKKITTT
jgi:hypothetical protein